MRLSPGLVCWSVVGGATVVHVLGAASHAPALAGQANAVALVGLAVLVLLRRGRGRLAVIGGIGVLAVDAVVSARELDGPSYMTPFYAPLSGPYNRPAGIQQGLIELQPYSAVEDLAWLGDSLSAQLAEHWPTLLGILLICGGTVATLAARPGVEARWRRRIAWAGAVVVAAILLPDLDGGALMRRVVTLGVLLPAMVALAAALTVLVVAADRQWRVAVPAMLGALLLAAAVLNADLAQVPPARPLFLAESHAMVAEVVVAVSVSGAPGFIAAPMLTLLAVALLVVASASGSGVPGPRSGENAGERNAQPGDGGDRQGHDD